jgi:hypothetical protein
MEDEAACRETEKAEVWLSQSYKFIKSHSTIGKLVGR